MWKGRIKRTNFFLVKLILGVAILIIDNYSLGIIQTQTSIPGHETLEIIKAVIYSLLYLVVALYMLCLSIRRAQDIGIRKGGDFFTYKYNFFTSQSIHFMCWQRKER